MNNPVDSTAAERALGVFPPKESALGSIFGTDRVVIGVVHCPPLPGSPHYRGEPLADVIRFAVEEATAYQQGGVHGLIVENAWDLPFPKPEDQGFETAANLAVISDHVREKVGLPVGVNVLANGAHCSIATAQAAQSAFVRVNQWANAYVANEGFMEGLAPSATRYRATLRAEQLKVFADVHVKHGSHSIIADRSLAEQTEDAEFFDADVLIATGGRTGDEAAESEVRGIMDATRLPVIIGSGMNEDNAERLLSLCHGAIVASSLKENGRWWGRVDRTKVRAFTRHAEKAGYQLP
ncbi:MULTISPECIES: BtpA/SgcQ family protein [unclassified Streptomyces]|uniref:BtpA/SgcQ family protein n=1 Tax=unclassified Streptomyces TaxID=2593676 RepID=UPI002E245C73|nr:BtpA/SgcQ family protein [Streptomyces sp. NBC_01023]